MKFRIETAESELFIFEESEAETLIACIRELLEDGVPFQTSYEYTWQEISAFDAKSIAV